MANIWTAHYRYSGHDRLDVTVKGQHEFGKLFAPNWDMVMAVKNHGAKAHQYYINEYNKILSNVPSGAWEAILSTDEVTLVCFCRQEDFCHRNLLVEYLTSNWPHVYYCGFRM